jgi:hypothetical protein
VACELVDEAIESVFGAEALNILQHCELMEDEADDATTREKKPIRFVFVVLCPARRRRGARPPCAACPPA